MYFNNSNFQQIVARIWRTAYLVTQLTVLPRNVKWQKEFRNDRLWWVWKSNAEAEVLYYDIFVLFS